MQKKQGEETNRATRIATLIIGGYAGFLGAVHGYFEILQGDITPGGIGINAIGAPCVGDAVWHACLPAMTIVPNFLVTGILAIVFSLVALVWVAVFIERKNGSLVLVLLSILMLLVGGGFIPAFTGVIAGVAATRIKTPLTFFQTHLPSSALRLLAELWPWTVIVFVIWSTGGWILGHYFNQAMMRLSFILFFFCDLGVPLLTVFTGFARDVHNRNHAVDG